MLELLLPELLLCVQLCLDSPPDLRNLIAASPASLHIFQQYAHLVRTTVLSNSIHHVALPLALAIVQIPSPERGHLSLHPHVLEPILDNYFKGGYDQAQLPEDRACLSRIERLCYRASFLAQDYATQAWRKIHENHPSSDPTEPESRSTPGSTYIHQNRAYNLKYFRWGTQEPHFESQLEAHTAYETSDDPSNAPHLSSSEQARLLRAFLLFELYCKIFPGCGDFPGDSDEDGPFITAAQQSDYFLRHLRPFEREELACVYRYYLTVLGDFFAQVEDDFVNEMLTAASHSLIITLPDNPRQSQSSSHHSSAESADYSPSHDNKAKSACQGATSSDAQAVLATELWENHGLKMFCSEETSWFYQDVMGYVVSKGTDFLYESIKADEDTRRELILYNVPDSRPFLPEALAFAWDNRSVDQDSQEDDQDDESVEDEYDDPSHPNRAWRTLLRNRDPPIFIGYIGCIKALRARGWVFWDSARLSSGAVNGGLAWAACPCNEDEDGNKNHATRECAEERLTGVMVPSTERDRICSKYGSTSWKRDPRLSFLV